MRRATSALPRSFVGESRPGNCSFGWGAQTRTMGGEAVARSAIGLQRAGIAVVDSDGNVTWTDETWAADDGEGSLPRVPIGANLLESYREYSDPRAQAIANAIAAVLDGKVTYFEIEHRSDPESPSFLTSVAALRGSGAGAVVIDKVVGGREPSERHRPTVVRASGGGALGPGGGQRAPRERRVGQLVAVGGASG